MSKSTRTRKHTRIAFAVGAMLAAVDMITANVIPAAKAAGTPKRGE